MTCDGSPGSPGVETYPGEDGPEKLACLGCLVCKPWMNPSFSDTVQVPVHMQHDPQLVEAVIGLAWARENPDAFKNADGIVVCKQTRLGPGCGHNVEHHIGENSPNPECPCCTWHLGPDGVVREPKMRGFSKKQMDAMDAQASLYAEGMGHFQAIGNEQIEGVVESLSGLQEQLLNNLAGMRPNRAARRRAQGKGRGIAGGNLPNRKRNR